MGGGNGGGAMVLMGRGHGLPQATPSSSYATAKWDFPDVD